MAKKVGHINIPDDVDVWDHEFRTAMALKRAGHDVDFIKKSNNAYERTPDCLVDGERWEMKAPQAANARAVQRNIYRALDQADRVIFDGRRMKPMTDEAIVHEINKWLPKLKSCKGFLYVNRHGEIVVLR